MDTFPPTYDLPMDLDDGTVYTDIHVDPASLPPNPAPDTDALQAPFVLSDEEMEEEDEPEEESEEEPLMNRTSDDDVAVPDPTDEDSSGDFPSDDDESDPRQDDRTTPVPTAPASVLATAPPSTTTYYFPPRNGGPRVVHTARKRVHLPGTDYASTSQALPPPPPHPAGLDGLDMRAHHPDRFMHIVDRQIDAMERRIAEQVRELRHREDMNRVEILNLRRRLLAIEDHLSGLRHR